MKLQNSKNLEQYIEAKITPGEQQIKVYPYTKKVTEMTDAISPHPGENVVIKLMNVVGKNHLKKIDFDLTYLQKHCYIECDVSIKLVDKEGWEKDKKYKDYSRMKQQFLDNKPYYPVVFWQYKNTLYSLDGMHRIMGALEAGKNRIHSYILIPRTEVKSYLTSKQILEVGILADKCTWFPRYQEIKEVSLSGQRKQFPRYPNIYNFSFLNGKRVLELGCNKGQATLEAYMNGASEVFGFDYQIEAIETARKIAKILNIDDIVKYDTVDFNNWTTMDKVKALGKFDWIIFQAVYRTKEINDIAPVMDYIYNNANEGVIFEGHADPKIDTPEFYDKNVFRRYNYNAKFLGHSDNRPAWILTK